MKKEAVMKYVNLLGIPVLTAVLGLILLLNPDSATALIARIIGWLLIIGGAVTAISMADRNARSRAGRWIAAAIGVILGIVVLKRPLLLAESLGRFMGVLLVIRGGSDLRESHHRDGRILAIITLIVGAVLILVPMTFTRTILRLCGMIVAVLGIVSIAEKIREMKLLEDGRRPDIIDADE